MAQNLETASAYNEFIKIKVLLMKGDALAAAGEVPKLLAAEDFTLDLLRASVYHLNACSQKLLLGGTLSNMNE